MAEAKKRLLTYAGLRHLRMNLRILKLSKGRKSQPRSRKRESRATSQRMQSMMLQKTNREILKHVSKNWKAFLRTQK